MHTIHFAPVEDVNILDGLVTAARLGLSREETLHRLGATAEQVEAVLESIRLSLPQLPPASRAETLAQSGIADMAPAAPVPVEATAPSVAKPALRKLNEIRQKAIAEGLRRGQEGKQRREAAMAALSPPPRPAKVSTARTAAPAAAVAPAVLRRVHRSGAQVAQKKAVAASRQIHVPSAERIPLLRRYAAAGKTIGDLPGLMGIGKARIYQLAREGGITFSIAKPAS